MDVPSYLQAAGSLQATRVSPDELEPTELQTSAVGHGVLVERDRLTAKYTGDARHTNDVGAVQANRPAPRKRLLYYYEVTIINEGLKAKVAVGFADKTFKLNRQPGWEPGSYGYHGDDGHKFHQTGTGADYGPKFGTGDVIGAGIHLGKGEIFFTKNGVKLKTAFRGVRGVLYPTVGLHSKNECVEVNFGAKPFRFDLQGLIAEERAALQANVDRVPVPPGDALALVTEYLEHSAFGDTLRALRAEAGDGQEQGQGAGPAAANGTCNGGMQQAEQEGAGPMSTEGDTSWLSLRQRVRVAVLRGDMDSALEALRTTCPEVLEPGQGYDVLHYQLYCQKFIELVRNRRVADALSWAHSTLSALRLCLPHLEAPLRETVALLAYEDPQSSPLRHLLSVCQRQAVAELTNSALLCAAKGMKLEPNNTPQSALSRALCQLVTVHEAILETNGGQGEPLDLPGIMAGAQHAPQQQHQTQPAMVS